MRSYLRSARRGRWWWPPTRGHSHHSRRHHPWRHHPWGHHPWRHHSWRHHPWGGWHSSWGHHHARRRPSNSTDRPCKARCWRCHGRHWHSPANCAPHARSSGHHLLRWIGGWRPFNRQGHDCVATKNDESKSATLFPLLCHSRPLSFLDFSKLFRIAQDLCVHGKGGN